MLAEACKSVEKAIEKCPRGMYSEIKYDGERVQLHKQGNEFKLVFFLYNIKEINFSQMLIFFFSFFFAVKQIFFKKFKTSFGS